jgi:periplasmic protein TonB
MIALTALILAAAQPAPRAERPGNLADYISGNDYPARALDLRQEGSVGFTVTVAPNGRVTGCAITRPSGHAELDEGTCRLARRRLRFNPAHARDGKPVEARSRPFRITWTIPGGAAD